jgi:hypothetical protein
VRALQALLLGQTLEVLLRVGPDLNDGAGRDLRRGGGMVRGRTGGGKGRASEGANGGGKGRASEGANGGGKGRASEGEANGGASGEGGEGSRPSLRLRYGARCPASAALALLRRWRLNPAPQNRAGRPAEVCASRCAGPPISAGVRHENCHESSAGIGSRNPGKAFSPPQLTITEMSFQSLPWARSPSTNLSCSASVQRPAKTKKMKEWILKRGHLRAALTREPRESSASTHRRGCPLLWPRPQGAPWVRARVVGPESGTSGYPGTRITIFRGQAFCVEEASA